MAKFCSGCGNPLEPGLKFCTVCGKKVEDAAPQPGAQAPTYGAPAPTQYQTAQPQVQQPQIQQPQVQYSQVQQPQVQQYGQYPGIPQAPQPAPQKSKKGLIIGLIAGAVIVIAVKDHCKPKDDDAASSVSAATDAETEAEAGKATEKSEDDAEEKAEDEATVKQEEKLIVDENGFSEAFFFGEDNIELTVWVADKALDLTEQLCRDFIAQYPNKTITIDIQVMSEGDASAQLLNDPEAGADVFGFAGDQLHKLYKANAIAAAGLHDEVKLHNTEASVKAATVDGTIYAYPMTGDNGYYLVYDKSVVSDEDAKTLEGVLKACRKAGRKMVIDSGNGFYSCMFAFTGGLTLEGIDNDVQQFNDYDSDAVERRHPVQRGRRYLHRLLKQYGRRGYRRQLEHLREYECAGRLFRRGKAAHRQYQRRGQADRVYERLQAHGSQFKIQVPERGTAACELPDLRGCAEQACDRAVVGPDQYRCIVIRSRYGESGAQGAGGTGGVFRPDDGYCRHLLVADGNARQLRSKR